jgi:hypothetical protein
MVTKNVLKLPADRFINPSSWKSFCNYMITLDFPLRVDKASVGSSNFELFPWNFFMS